MVGRLRLVSLGVAWVGLVRQVGLGWVRLDGGATVVRVG